MTDLDAFTEELIKIAMPVFKLAPRSIPRTPTLAVRAGTSMRSGTASLAKAVNPAQKILGAPMAGSAPVLRDARRSVTLSPSTPL